MPQALIGPIAADTGDLALATTAASAAPVGYALSLVLSLPLSDRTRPTAHVGVHFAALTVALAFSAVVDDALLPLAFGLLGVSASGGQVILATLARQATEHRATVTAVVLSAMVLGMFGGRMLTAAIAADHGWRRVVLAFAALAALSVLVTARALRDVPPAGAPPGPYGRLVVSAVRMLREVPRLRRLSGAQLFLYASFNVAWCAAPLHLTSPRVGMDTGTAGLVGALGLVAGVALLGAGRLVTAHGTALIARTGVAVALVGSVALAVTGSGGLVAPGIALLLLTVACLVGQSAMQTEVLALVPGATARANTGYMAMTFVGAAAGTAVAPAVLHLGGVAAVGAVCTALVLLAGALLLTGRPPTR